MIPLTRRSYYANMKGEQRQISKLLLKEQEATLVRNIEFKRHGSFECAPGYQKINALDVNSAPDPYLINSVPAECIGMFDFQLSAGGQHLMYAARENTGPTYSRIGRINLSTGVLTYITPSAAGDNRLPNTMNKIRFAQMEDICIAGSSKHPPFYDDGALATMRRVGLPPVAENLAGIASQSTGGTLADGTYNFRVTYYTTESATAPHEGRVNDAMVASDSFITVTIAAGGGTASIDLALPAIDATTLARYGQITGRSIYMTTESGATFYWKVDSPFTTAQTVNITSLPTVVNNAISPNVTNDLPPHADIWIQYQGRIFAANGRSPNYNTGQAGANDHWDRVWVSALTGEYNGKRPDGKQQYPLSLSFRIDPGAGEPITGMFVEGGILYATKRRKIYRVYELENDPVSVWTYDGVSHATGCISHDGIAHTENLPFFPSERLVYMWNGRSVDPVGNEEESMWADDLNIKRLEESVGAYERAPQRNRYKLLCSTTGATANHHDLMLEFDFRNLAWRRRDDFPDMSYIISVEQTTGEDLLYSADYEGFVYKWPNNIYNYGAGAQADDILIGTATSGSATTINDTGQAWNINEFKNVPVYITGGTGQGQRGVVSSNTATQLVFPAATFVTAPDATSVYEIGAYTSRYQGRWDSFNEPAMPKRGRYFFIVADAQSKATKLKVYERIDFEKGDGLEHVVNMLGPGAVFGTAVFGSAVFGGLDTIQRQFAIGRKWNWFQPIFENIGTNAPWRVYGWDIEVQVLSSRRSVSFAEALDGVI